MIRKILKVTLLLLLVAVWCGVSGVVQSKNSRLDLDDVELMADPEAALEVDPDIFGRDRQKKNGGSRRGFTGAESGGDGK